MSDVGDQVRTAPNRQLYSVGGRVHSQRTCSIPGGRAQEVKDCLSDFRPAICICDQIDVRRAMFEDTLFQDFRLRSWYTLKA